VRCPLASRPHVAAALRELASRDRAIRSRGFASHEVCSAVHRSVEPLSPWHRTHHRYPANSIVGLALRTRVLLVRVGPIGTNYNYGIVGTNLGNDCPTESPTPPPPTASPNSALPCCEMLRENPIFCCLESRNPSFALSVCQECGI
jgi:hypothetical protein